MGLFILYSPDTNNDERQNFIINQSKVIHAIMNPD